MKRLITIFLNAIVVLFPLITFAQESDVEMADTMRSNGKIYVVIGVIAIVLAGLLIYLMMIDKKVRILEKNSKK